MPHLWGAQLCGRIPCVPPNRPLAFQVTQNPPLLPRLRAVHADHWPELALKEVSNQVEGVRCRQHVNPLKKELQVQLPPQDWAQSFDDPARPLIVDIGCGPGRFLLALSQRFQGHNMLGLDIREKLIERANSWAGGLGLQGSVHFMMANATVSLGSMLSSYPGPLTLVTVQFPDPHFKTKHKKRRVIQPQVVRTLERLMPPGGRVFLQSDVNEAATAMYEEFREHGSESFFPDLSGAMLTEDSLSASLSAAASDSSANSSTASSLHAQKSIAHGSQLSPHQPHEQQDSVQAVTPTTSVSAAGSNEAGQRLGARAEQSVQTDDAGSSVQDRWPPDIRWLEENPLGIPTEREVHSQKRGGSVYRALLVRC